jgi:hypothetical protein
MATLALACAGAACTRSAPPADGADASVTFRSAATTGQMATWQNLWGSWPFARYYHSLVYDSNRNVMVLYGGQQGANGPYLDDTWEWDGARGVWNEKTPAPNGTMTSSPQARAQQMMVFDPVQKKAFMFSGWQPQAGVYAPDQWEWDGTTWTDRSVTSGPQPNPRYGGTLVWDSDRNRAVLFGGFAQNLLTSATARTNDVWEWDGTGAGTWTNRTPAASATQPSPRMYHHAVYDSNRKKMVVYSGNTGMAIPSQGTWVDETWEWDGAAGSWTKVTPASGSSIPYYSSDVQLVYDAGRSVVVAYYYIGQMWEYVPDPTTPKWNPITTTKANTADGDTPPYNYTTPVYDPVRAQIVVFAGYSGSTRDLWELDGTAKTWVNRSVPVNGPVQRNYPSVAYDSKRGKVMAFGGYSTIDGLVKQDIWEWSGTDATWTPRTNLNTKPQGRQQGAMVYDSSSRDQLLLWGGSGTGVTNDLWAWSPTTKNWAIVPITGPAPPLAANVPMFYDPKRDKLELWISYYQYYEFDFSTSIWTNRYDTKSPAPGGFTGRGYVDVTYDTDRSKMLFVAGYGTENSTGSNVWDADVWEWDAATNVFTERLPPAAGPNPAGRNNHVVSYDSSRRVVVMFGGYGQTTAVNGPQNDSWEWDGVSGAWTETTPAGVKPLPRQNHIQIFDSMKATTLVFGGNVSGDPTYGPQEIWEYFASTSKRPNGSGCSPANASNCQSGFCVDGVCCEVMTCSGTCKSCAVPGMAGKCLSVPVGSGDDTCPSDQACDANQACKKLIGQQCASFGDCASGHCADGVCCNTDCNETCKTCSLATSRGTCAFVPSGNEDPVGAPACVSSDMQGRSCDGAGTCANLPKPAGKPCTAGGQCGSGFCIDGVCCNSQCAAQCYQCDRTGYVGSCVPTLNGDVDHSASMPCDSAGQSCNGSGQCTMGKKPNGSTCGAASECTSNFCVDGTCCVSACTSTCQSCGVPGSLGACVNLPAGSQDTNSSPLCNANQYCDAAGTCQTGSTPNGLACTAASQCGSGQCVDGVCCVNACGDPCMTCNGSMPGTCTGERTGFADPACMTGQFCNDMHKCASGARPNGATCVNDIDCASTFCVDGTCCESVCAGTCRTCANATGTCAFAAAGTDAHNNCKGEKGCGGKCNGQGACLWAPAMQSCRPAGCQTDLGLVTKELFCDGAGNCDPTDADVTQNCNGFGCDPTAGGGATCRTDCSTDPECAIRRYCEVVPDGGVADGGAKSTCPAQFTQGHACLRNTQCLTGTCSDGVCCDKNCDKCGSCNTPGMVGTCIPIPAGTDPEMECISNASDPTHKCAGLCNGQAACQYPLAGTSCGLCAACDGSGLCSKMPADDTACNTIDCSGLNTPGACKMYSDLTSNRCDSVGACKTKNTVKACTVVTDSCPTDGGSPGTGGSTGGGGGHGGAGGSGTGGSATGTAGSTGTDGGAGKGGGGGGCGCVVGGADSASSLAALLALACVMITRRRRR